MACGGQTSPSAPSASRLVGDGGTVPASEVQIEPGARIQDAVDAHPGATTFRLKTGIHHRQSITPRSGNRFIGEQGTVLDGDGVTAHAFETLGTAPRGVLIQGLEIRNYAPPSSLGAVQADNGADWVVDDNAIHDNASTGLRMGPRMQVLRNRVYRNGLNGIVGYRADSAVVDGNDVHDNNASGGTSSGVDAGMKLTGCRDITIRNNYVHNNNGKGIWSDTNYPTATIENNTVTDNTDAGIWHEISYDAVIRNNTVERNGGSTAPSWLQRAGIAVTNSANVQVYGNSLRDNANGIGVMYASGYSPTGPYGPYIVQNLSVHDNIVRMTIGRTGFATNTGDASVYRSQNNRFDQNTYYLGRNATYFLWNEQNMPEGGWQAAGNDVNGTFIR